ncbi:hypothetical protein GCM10011378_41550 [Hymenobacter glacieicola]|uniref:Peptidase n=1 Tax=Hymenobacter glacieicola TaxID=1562124 RepID=A0ABQ1X5Q7_9BACT|nr:hypothetical protein GCM10011378_41550 [Hymenobacter glacieicola]
MDPAATPSPAAAATPATPDYNAYLQEQFGVSDPAAIKAQLAEVARVAELEKNQRTQADLTIQQWLTEKPAEALEYFRLQQTDFNAAPGKDVLLEVFQRSPEMAGLSADVVKTIFEDEYQQKYGVLDFADDTDPETQQKVRVAQARLTQAETAARAQMNGVKAAAQLPVPQAPTQPSQADIDRMVVEHQQRLDAYLATGKEVFKVGDLDVEVPVTNREAFIAAADDPIAFINSLILTPEGQPNYAGINRLLVQLTQDVSGAALAAYQAKQPASVPVATLTNPPAPQAAPPAAGDWIASMRQAVAERGSVSTNNSSIYGY